MRDHIEVLNKIKSEYVAECSDCGDCGDCDDKRICFDFSAIQALNLAIKALEKEPKRGKWIVDRYCSECEWDKQEASYTSGWRENYCPNCGTRMESD